MEVLDVIRVVWETEDYTLVRAYLGHRRLDTEAQLEAVNALYDRMWLYYNPFQPVLRLVAKERVGQDRIKLRHDEAKTPYERLLATGVLAADQQERLSALYAATNPRALRREIHQAIARLWDEPWLEAVANPKDQGQLLGGLEAIQQEDPCLAA